MLLVNHREAEGVKDDIVFEQCVGAHYYANAAVFKSGMDFPAFLLGAASGEQCAADAGWLQIAADIRKVLLCKNFCGRHDAGLVAVVYRKQSAQDGHHGFSGAYIALQQAVHLVPAFHVVVYLADNSLLRSGQFVRKGIVARIECGSDLRERQTYGTARVYVFLLQQTELQKEQFFELQSTYRFFQGIMVGGEMDIAQCISQRHQGVVFQHIIRKRLLDFRKTHRKCRALQFAHHLAGNATVLEFLRARIDTRERPPGLCTSGNRIVNFRMHNVETAVKIRWFAEKQEGAAWFQTLVVPFDALEEHHLHLSAPVVHYHAQALCRADFYRSALRHLRAASRPYQSAADDRSLNLNVCKISAHVPDGGDACAVDVAEGVDVKQVTKGFYAQFGLEESGPFGPHPAKVLYFRIKRRHNYKDKKKAAEQLN